MVVKKLLDTHPADLYNRPMNTTPISLLDLSDSQADAFYRARQGVHIGGFGIAPSTYTSLAKLGLVTTRTENGRKFVILTAAGRQVKA